MPVCGGGKPVFGDDDCKGVDDGKDDIKDDGEGGNGTKGSEDSDDDSDDDINDDSKGGNGTKGAKGAWRQGRRQKEGSRHCGLAGKPHR